MTNKTYKCFAVTQERIERIANTINKFGRLFNIDDYLFLSNHKVAILYKVRKYRESL